MIPTLDATPWGEPALVTLAQELEGWSLQDGLKQHGAKLELMGRIRLGVLNPGCVLESPGSFKNTDTLVPPPKILTQLVKSAARRFFNSPRDSRAQSRLGTCIRQHRGRKGLQKTDS